MIRAKDVKVYAYALAIGLMTLFSQICQWAGDENLPPQKPAARLWINAIYLLVFASYVWLLRRREGFSLAKRHWAALIFSGLLLCSMSPIFSGDLHEYLMRGRILGVYRENPYLVPHDYPSDFFYSLTVWVGLHKIPENYGPLWTLIGAVMPALFKNSYVLSVFFFKLLLFGFLAGSALLFRAIARTVSPANADWLTALFALNPNMLSHILIDGHNDIVMVFLMLGAFLMTLKGRDTASAALLTLAVLIKFTSVMLLPVLVIWALKSGRYKTGDAKAAYLISVVAVLAALTTAFYLPFWVGPQTIGYFSKFGDWFASNSVPFAVHAGLGRIGLHLPVPLMKLFFNAFFALNVAGALAWLARRKTADGRSASAAIAWIFLAMYASYTIPFYGHHLLWAFGFMLLAEWPAPLLWSVLYAGVGVFFYFKRPSVLFLGAAAAYSAFLAKRRLG